MRDVRYNMPDMAVAADILSFATVTMQMAISISIGDGEVNLTVFSYQRVKSGAHLEPVEAQVGLIPVKRL